ncbi:MAG TPA: hypothetical protein VK157_02890 [Phycisphaerales bacterium]|nr:hypothetical protein [Phycisphaerales bacterium]
MFNIGTDLHMWIDPNSVICIKAVTSLGDPVELNLDEARVLLNKVSEFIRIIEQEDQSPGESRSSL